MAVATPDRALPKMSDRISFGVIRRHTHTGKPAVVETISLEDEPRRFEPRLILSYWAILGRFSAARFSMERPLLPVSTMFIGAPIGHPLRFTPALRFGANASLWPSPHCALRHPSGDPAPSSADVQVTRQLREASRAMDIEPLDHVILGEATAVPTSLGFYSFRQAVSLESKS